MLIKLGPINAMTNDELIESQALLDLMHEQMRENGHEAPGDFKTKQSEVNAELTNRLRGEKERQLQGLRIRRQSLLTRDQKMSQTEEEIERLEVELGLRTKPTAKAGRSR